MNALRRRLLSLPRFRRRPYTTTTTTNNNLEIPAPRAPQNPQSSSPAQLQAPHGTHERTTALNVPINPPGGPGGSTPGGGTFTFTNSPILDGMITTAIGLGAGKTICQHI